MITRRLFKFLEHKKKVFKKNKSFIVFIADGDLMFWLFGSFNWFLWNCSFFFALTFVNIQTVFTISLELMQKVIQFCAEMNAKSGNSNHTQLNTISQKFTRTHWKLLKSKIMRKHVFVLFIERLGKNLNPLIIILLIFFSSFQIFLYWITKYYIISFQILNWEKSGVFKAFRSI